MVIKEVFANGRLAPGSTDTSPGVQKASRLAAELQIGLDQLALAVALQQPWMPRVLSGAVTVSNPVSSVGPRLICRWIWRRVTGESEDPSLLGGAHSTGVELGSQQYVP